MPSGRDPDPIEGDELALVFPDLPRLELEELLSQLVDRAQEVMATQGRLRGLLRANQAIIGDLELPVLLRRIVEAARTLVGSRYAALGVISPDGGLAEFVHVGMEDEVVGAIGHLPQGKGLLGALIDDPHPIRLERIASDERSSGFPDGHPPMDSFLGVPVRVRDTVFGNLYLAESVRGSFSAEDEELAAALAATAGMVIDNARLFELADARQEWLRASADVTHQLLSGEAGNALRLIAERYRELARADLVTVIRSGSDGGVLRVAVAVGTGAEEVSGTRMPVEGTLSGQVFTTGTPVRVDLPEESGLTTVPGWPTDLGPVMVVPMRSSERVHGVLTAARSRHRAAFAEEELAMAAGFANQASVAIELAQARAEQQRAAMLDDRDRIAADLHDHVIQRLFGAGLSLQGVASTIPEGTARDRLLTTITDLDDTISQIRTTIYQLARRETAEQGLRGRLLGIVQSLVPTLGFEPGVRFSGVLDHAVPDDLADDIEAVLREALTNIARHARAGAATVSITASTSKVVLSVSDDGVGMDPAVARRSGLANLRRRAEQHGGELEIRPREPHGTELMWSAQLG